MTGVPPTQKYNVSADVIVRALLADARFNLQIKGGYLRGGPCPECGKNELFTSTEKPWILKCSRENRCGWEENTIELLPDLFADFAKKYKPTEEEPNRTADAYLGLQRGFDLSKIRGWYEQEAFQDRSNGRMYSTIRFYLDEAKRTYWQRLIDPDEGVKKARFQGSYKGQVWTHPYFTLEEGERCMVVEGIFHAIALHHKDIKAAAALSCVNFPDAFIEQHKGKRIRWTIALDGDKAGKKYAKAHMKKLHAMGEKCEVLLLPEGQDWDDLYRAGKITKRFIDYCLYNGRLFLSETVNEKAYHYYARKRSRRFILDFDNMLFSIKVDAKLDKELYAIAANTEDDGDENKDDIALFELALLSPRGKDLFYSFCDVDKACSVVPEFLYMEYDEVMDEQFYVFKVRYGNGSKEKIISLEGTSISSPDSFHKTLLSKTNGGTFYGDSRCLKILCERWLDDDMLTVSSIPFVGYHKQLGAYVYQNHAYSNGKEIPLNDHGYFQLGKQGIKTSLSGVSVNTSGSFSPDWLENYVKVFNWQGLALLAYWLGTLFAQQIRAEQKTFPFLEFTGEPGAGKSTALEFCWKLVGRDDYEGFDIMKASMAGRRRAFNQLSNLPVVLIESDRDGGDRDAKARQLNWDELKAFYNGRSTGTLGIAKRGNDVEEHQFQASLVISQNAEVDGSEALLQRIVHCHVDKRHHKAGTRDLARWFERQTSDTVGGFLRTALQNEQKILKTYFEAFTRLEQQYTSTDLKLERVVKNHAQIAACGYALAELFPAMTQERCQKLTQYLYERATDREDRLAADHPLVAQFWETYQYLNEERSTSAKDGWLNHSNEPTRIAINLNQYRDLCVSNGQELPDMKALKKLLQNSRKHKFLSKSESIYSPHLSKTIRCWVFEVNYPK